MSSDLLQAPADAADYVLSRRQVAARFGVHVATVKRWEDYGWLKPARLGPHLVRHSRAAVAELLARARGDDARPLPFLTPAGGAK